MMKKYFLMLLVYFSPLLLLAAEVSDKLVLGDVISDLSKAIINVLLPVLIACIGLLIKRGTDLIKVGFIQKMVKRAVISAYQKYVDKQHNSAKYDMVVSKVRSNFKYLTEEEIRDYIEEAVMQLKIELQKLQ